ncbi:MAG: hypothetical protein AAFR90_11120 [Pseudomonadota bacterium]
MLKLSIYGGVRIGSLLLVLAKRSDGVSQRIRIVFWPGAFSLIANEEQFSLLRTVDGKDISATGSLIEKDDMLMCPSSPAH